MICIGAIIGDTIGSVYEFSNIKSKNFDLENANSRMTDDSFMTLAVIEYFSCNCQKPIESYLRKWGLEHPFAGYGLKFNEWIMNHSMGPYFSYGNGAAMRISPVGWFCSNEKEVKMMSHKITACSHNHPEAIKAAEVVSMCIYYAKIGKTKKFIENYIKRKYEINFDYKSLVENYIFDETCQGSVPQALYCFLISDSFEDCLRTAVSIGGDSDTIAAIACSIAEAYYKKIPIFLMHIIESKLTDYEKCLLLTFESKCKEHNKKC